MAWLTWADNGKELFERWWMLGEAKPHQFLLWSNRRHQRQEPAFRLVGSQKLRQSIDFTLVILVEFFRVRHPSVKYSWLGGRQRRHLAAVLYAACPAANMPTLQPRGQKCNNESSSQVAKAGRMMDSCLQELCGPDNFFQCEDQIETDDCMEILKFLLTDQEFLSTSLVNAGLSASGYPNCT